MWPFKSSKSHLKYRSIWEWKQKECIPDNFISHEDPVLRGRWITEYGELHQHLFEIHIETLDAEEQRMFREQRHPSQSHRFHHRAMPCLDSLKTELDQAGIKFTSICLGYYHMDRLVLSVDIDPESKIDPKDLPWLHRGFEIKIGHSIPRESESQG